MSQPHWGMQQQLMSPCHVLKVTVIEGGSWWLNKGKCCTSLQEEQEGFKELQTGQPNISSWEDYAANPPGTHFQTHEWPEGKREQSAWIYQGKSQLNCLMWWEDWLSEETTFETVSHRIIVKNLERAGTGWMYGKARGKMTGALHSQAGGRQYNNPRAASY